MKTIKNQGAALVIGGSGGLGSEICRRLAGEWDALFFTYRSNEAAARQLREALLPELAVDCCAMDIREQASIDQALAQAVECFGRIGTVIFASGVSIEQPFVSQITAEQWDEVIHTELLGFTRLARAVLRLFKTQGGGGNLVCVTSFAIYHFPPGDALSAVPKAGIEVLCRAIAKEEGRNGIRANAVAPGIIDAGLGLEFQQKFFSPEVWEGQRKRVPLKRFGEGCEIAVAVAFLASARAGYITGQTLIVDGGLSL